jgi:hypothetical protein
MNKIPLNVRIVESRMSPAGTEHASIPPSSVPESRHGDFASPNRPVEYRSIRPEPFGENIAAKRSSISLSALLE